MKFFFEIKQSYFSQGQNSLAGLGGLITVDKVRPLLLRYFNFYLV